jgi:sulfite oxidase
MEQPVGADVNPDSADGDLVVIRQEPFNAESPLPALQEPYTPTRHFYVRSSFPVPPLAAADWRLAIGGAVTHPYTLSLAELQALPGRTLPATLECAGNNRTGLAPLPQGEPWGAGAISTGRWRGVALAELLERAGLHPSVVELLFEGADGGLLDGRVEPLRFTRSLPRGKALDPDTLLAYELDDAPLPPAHGGPVRLLVPDWYGIASVKWLIGITALEEPFQGYFQAQRYIYDLPGAADKPPVQTMRVKSLITHPTAGAVLLRQPQRVSGMAWSGDGAITQVAVNVEGAGAWQPAQLLGDPMPHTWQPWEFTWTPRRAGRHVLRARATDAQGHTQPDVPVWNRLGYGNNAVQLVVVDVRDA